MNEKMRSTKSAVLTISVHFHFYIQAILLFSFPNRKQSKLVAFHAVFHLTVGQRMI